jgi:hypothetical protein
MPMHVLIGVGVQYTMDFLSDKIKTQGYGDQ